MKYKNWIKAVCVALVVCFAVCGLVACGNDAAKKITVNIVDGGKKTPVEIETGKTVKDALDAAKITLGEGDKCEPPVDAKITEDTKEITITRAVVIKKVKLTVNGNSVNLQSSAETVRQLLEEKKITVGKDDTVTPGIDAPLTEGMEIVIVYAKSKTETTAPTAAPKTEAPAATEAVENNDDNGDNNSDDNGGEYSEPDENADYTPDENVDTDNNGDAGNEDAGNDGGNDGGVYEVDRQAMPDCDGSGHGVYIITYSDGSTGTEEY